MAQRPKISWTKERIQGLISANALALERALLVVYENQTLDEKRAGDTAHDNGVGFTGSDARFLSSVAAWVQRSTYREGYRLTPGQRERVLPLMLKYWRQVQREIVRKEEIKERYEQEKRIFDGTLHRVVHQVYSEVSAAPNDQVVRD